MKIYMGLWTEGVLKGCCSLYDNNEYTSAGVVIIAEHEVDFEYPCDDDLAAIILENEASNRAKKKAKLIAELEELNNE